METKDIFKKADRAFLLLFRWLLGYVKALLPQFSFPPLFFLMSLFLASSEAQGEPAPGMSLRNGPRAESCQTHKWNKRKFVAGAGE